MTWADPILRTHGMPIWANYIARDVDGSVFVYAKEPRFYPGTGLFKPFPSGGAHSAIFWPPHYEPAAGVIAHLKEAP